MELVSAGYRATLNLAAHMTTIPKNSIKFSAEAAFGHTGQFIARVTGPDSRFGALHGNALPHTRLHETSDGLHDY